MRIWVLALGLVACGSDHDPGDAAADAAATDAAHAFDAPASPDAFANDTGHDAALDGGPPYGDIVSSFCMPLLEATCDHAARCGACGTFDRDACIARGTEACAQENAPGIASGDRVVLANVRDCLARLALADPCDDVDFARCGALGAAPEGSCTDGALCDAGHGVCDGGACQPLPLAGAACPEYACAAGLFCASPSHVCMPQVADGDACTASAECVYPSRCIAGHCGGSVAIGGACASSDDCGVGAACSAHVCAASTHCAACGRASRCESPMTCQALLAAGATCGDDTDCLSGACTSGHCAAPTAIGASCATLACGTSAYCGMDALCHARGASGAACNIDVAGSCDEGLACVASACTNDLPAVGDPCGAAAACAEGASCHEGACVAFTLGTGCNPGAGDCPCIAGAAGVPVCSPPAAIGDPCALDAACPWGAVCRASGASACVPAVCDQLAGRF